MDALSLSDVTDVGVVGAGSMGHGIAQVFATAGYSVRLVDVSDDVLESARDSIRSSLERLGHDPAPILDRIETTTDRAEGLRDADLMVEAVPEDVELKRDVFATADEVTAPDAVLATNTSTLPITEIATATERPERVVGMHFSNPVPLIELVEVIRGERTRESVVELTVSLSEAVGKTPVVVHKDVPGFLLNRINPAFWGEALRAIDSGGWEPESVDAAVRRLGFPMGPFEVLDFAGVDVFYLVSRALQERDVPVRISETHEELYEAGNYGMKTGEGFYEYPEPGTYARADVPLARRHEYDPYRMIAAAVNVAAWLLAEDVTTRDDVETAMRIGMSWPRGPLTFADEYGIDRIVEVLEGLHEECGWEQYAPHPLLEEMVEQGRLGVKTGEGFFEHDHERDRYGQIEYDRRNFYAMITVSGPLTSSPKCERTWTGLGDALERAGTDGSVRATIIRATSETFAGGDDDGVSAEGDGVDAAATSFDEVVGPVLEAIRTHPKPTIGLLEGDVRGIGCVVVLSCDMAVASEGSQFGPCGTTMGPCTATWLTRAAGDLPKKKLLELAMTGDAISAAEAEASGLVNYAVSDRQAFDVARELARSTTDLAPETVESISKRWSQVEADLGS